MLIVACAVLIHHVALWVAQRRMLFPGGFMSLGGAPRTPGLVELKVEHDEGATFGFLKRYSSASADRPAPLVVYAHGNAEIIADWVFDVEPYTARGFHFLAVEYRGFGTSNGTPSEAHFHSDIQALIAEATQREDVDGDRIVYHGRSLGGAVLGSLARKTNPSALILESTFSSVHSMARRFLAPRYLVRDPLDVHSTLAKSYSGPVMLLHSRVDEVIPFAQFERNLAAARSRRAGSDGNVETAIHETMGHNDTWLTEAPMQLADFAASAAGLASAD
ncbi:MAG: alpha/beta hydrolase [Planctomycetota bacterium]